MALTVKDSSGNNATVTALVFGDPILANSHIFNTHMENFKRIL